MKHILTLVAAAGIVVLAACGGGDTADVTVDSGGKVARDAETQAVVDLCALDGTAQEICGCTADALKERLDRDTFAALSEFATALKGAESDDARAQIFMDGLNEPRLLAAFEMADEAETACLQAAVQEETKAQVAAAEAASQERRQQAARRECPPALSMTPRPGGAPVDDVADLRPGMSLDDVEAILECRGDIHNFDMAQEWARRSQGLETRQLLRAADGDLCPPGSRAARDGRCEDGGYSFELLQNVTQEFIVALAGMPGEERAGIIWRRTAFPENRYPTLSALTEALEEKYGQPHIRATEEGYYSLGHRRGTTTYSWLYMPNGSPIPREESAHRARCVNGPRPTFQRRMNWNGGCGLTVRAEIVPAEGRPSLARELNVVVMNQRLFNEAFTRFGADIEAAVEAAHRDRGVRPDL
jgi:hypothetical protein